MTKAKRGRPKTLSIILRGRLESTPDIPENQERIDKLCRQIQEAQASEARAAKIKMAERAEKRAANKSKPEVSKMNPGVRAFLDKQKGEKT